MEDVDAFTYNDIYELLRGEKNSADMEELTPAVLDKISYYISCKIKLLESSKGGTFASAKERSKILSEIDNAQQALRDLFERRQRKVINRALYTVRTDSKLKDTTNMLENEEALYNVLLKQLKKAMDAFTGVLEGKIADSCDSGNAKAVEGAESGSPAEDYKTDGLLAIKFLDSVPELVDTSLEKHGPFERGDNAKLPVELANLLIRQSKAKEV